MALTLHIITWLQKNMSCKRFARHVASEVDPFAGGFSSRLHFWLHWAICPFCRRYWDEIRAIGEIQRSSAAIRNHPAVKIPEIKSRIKANLRRRLA